MKISNHILIKLSLIIFILLFIYLFYFESTYKINKTEIININDNNLNKIIKIECKIYSQTLNSNGKNDMIFLKLYDNTSNINAIIFNSNVKLNEKNKYEIIGKIIKYKQEYEINIIEINKL